MAPEVAAASVDAIRMHSGIVPSLTLWAGALVLAPPYLQAQNELGARGGSD